MLFILGNGEVQHDVWGRWSGRCAFKRRNWEVLKLDLLGNSVTTFCVIGDCRFARGAPSFEVPSSGMRTWKAMEGNTLLQVADPDFLRQENGCRDNGRPLAEFIYDSGLGDIPAANHLAADFPELPLIVPAFILVKFHTQC